MFQNKDFNSYQTVTYSVVIWGLIPNMAAGQTNNTSQTERDCRVGWGPHCNFGLMGQIDFIVFTELSYSTLND